MNKSIITNFIAITCIFAGYILNQHLVLTVGLFAFSGAITNWLAVHMLFEKVPGLYGSGVIPARFEDFKLGIRHLLMEQFFTTDNIDRFLSEKSNKSSVVDLAPVIAKVDLAPVFDNLIDVIENSSFGGMLAMVGGSDALMPLKDPFIEKMKVTVIEITQSDEFNTMLSDELGQSNLVDGMQSKVSDIVEKRLNELTPELVKEIVQVMIRRHLGWLVVWGGVFGGVLGLIAALTNNV
ncbi:MAG: uncharacterized membrane protein YheB (UPF0754 family) [Granulosicoccus sp.]